MLLPGLAERWKAVVARCAAVGTEPARYVEAAQSCLAEGRPGPERGRLLAYHGSLLAICGGLDVLSCPFWREGRPDLPPPPRYDPAVICQALMEACIAANWWRKDRILDVMIAVLQALAGDAMAERLWAYLDARLEANGTLLAPLDQKVYRRIRSPQEATSDKDP